MRIFRRFTLTATFLLLQVHITATAAESNNLAIISQRLQKVLNKRRGYSLEQVFPSHQAEEIRNKQINLLNRFPDTKWIVKPSTPLQDGRPTLNILTSSKKQSQGQKFTFEAQQKLAIKTKGMKITSQELISEYSILRSGKETLPIRIGIPDIVLTGTRYDVDVIFETPLGESIVAGGLINLNPSHINNQTQPHIELAPLHSGGLFKSVKAPLKPGSQRWAALLAHPDGIISITKHIKVVSKESEL